MAITRGATSLNGSGTTTSITFDRAAAVVNGSLLYVEAGWNSSGVTMSPPDGTWVQAYQAQHPGGVALSLGAWYKVVTDAGSDPGSYTFTLSGSGAPVQGSVTVFSGVSTTTPLDVAVSTLADTTNGSSLTIPGITTVTNGCYLLTGITANTSFGTDVIEPSGFTTIRESTNNNKSALAGMEQATAGASGDAVWNIVQSRQGLGYLLALRPATGGGPTTVSGSASLTAAPTITTNAGSRALGSAALTAAPTITASATVTTHASATLTAAPTITASATVTAHGAASLTAAPTITATAVGGELVVAGSAGLNASAALTATATSFATGSASLTADASVTATARVVAHGAASLTADITLTLTITEEQVPASLTLSDRATAAVTLSDMATASVALSDYATASVTLTDRSM